MDGFTDIYVKNVEKKGFGLEMVGSGKLCENRRSLDCCSPRTDDHTRRFTARRRCNYSAHRRILCRRVLDGVNAKGERELMGWIEIGLT